MQNNQDNLVITKQELHDLFQAKAFPDDGYAWALSKSKGKNCVEMIQDTYSNITIRVLHQSTPVSQSLKWKNPGKDLVIKLDHQKDDLYKVSSAVAFRYGYTSNGSSGTATLIFNTVVECVKDVVERDGVFQEDRFANLKNDMIALEDENRQKSSYYQYPV